jgi:hypothetical protein
MKSHIQAGEKCPKCGGEVIYWYPESIDFTDLPTKIAAATTLSRCDGNPREPQHPGRFCLGGCFAQMFNIDSRDFWEKLERDRAARETASILVRLATPNTNTLEAIKLYLDRNVRRTAPRDVAPPNCEYIEMEPGTHTLIARDYDHRDPNRRESNLIEFSIGEGQRLVFDVCDENGFLKLTQGEQDDTGQPTTCSESN